MSIETNKVLIRHLIALSSTRNLEAYYDFFAPSCIFHWLPARIAPTFENAKKVATLNRTAFPDMQTTIEDLVAEGDKIALRATLRATQTGAFGSIPASGKQVEFTGIWIARIDNGQIVEEWSSIDALGLLQQIGALPASTPPQATPEKLD